MSATYLVASARTPIGKFGGALLELSPVQLAAQTMQAVLGRAGLPHLAAL